MRSTHAYLPVLLALLAAACTSHEAASPQTAAAVQAQLITVESSPLATYDAVPGSIVSDQRVRLASRVVGFIQSLEVKEGDRVSRGQVLAQIDPRDIDAAIHQASAQLEAAQAELADAELDAAAYADLSQTGAVGGQEARKASTRRDIARASVAQAQTALAAARQQRSYTTILSPVDGLLVRRDKRPGELAVVGEPLLTLESSRKLLFRCFVSSENLARLAPGQAVMINFDDLGSLQVSGRVRDIVPSGDPLTRHYEVSIALPQDDDALRPGMFGRAQIALGEVAATLIPNTALVDRGGLDGVFVVGDDNVARFRWLRLGRPRGDRAEVVAGLDSGERIIAVASVAIVDGTVVQSMQAPQ